MKSKDYVSVLIVDDKPENLLVVESILEGLDITIKKAHSGNEALSLLLDYDFGLVILDIQMPEMDGFEVADLMKGMEKTRNIPIIFLTAIYKEEYSILKGYEVGAVDYLFKPIQPVILRSKVKVFMSLYEQKEQLKKQASVLEERIEELEQLRRTNWQLETLSQIDGLTGVANRRSLDFFIKKHWAAARSYSTFLALIMVDIDYFKLYNDNYGHLQGDICLRNVASQLKQTVENEIECLVGRFGGEEFSIVLPNKNQSEALQIAEQIQTNLNRLALKHEYSPLCQQLTVSIGIASMIPVEEISLEEYIERADKALYNAKNRGRNRVVCFSEAEFVEVLN